MNNLFYSLSLAFLLFTTHVSAIVSEASDLKVIEREINQLDDNALVVFDIDYTLIVPNDLILAPCGEVYFQAFMKKLRALEEQGEVLGSKVSLKSQVSLVDEKIIELLSILEQKKIKTIGLTAMPTGKFGLISNAEEWRVKQLDSLGINFLWSFPSIDSITLNKFEGKKTQPVFKQGVLASAKYPKGQVLVEFLRQVQWKPSKVIFVDDRMEYIESVETELSKEQIPLISFHYTAATDRPCQLDKEVADFQLDYLMQKGEWLSDEEAKKSLNSAHHKIVRRAAFDIGSGQIKMQISDVDLTANKIINVLLTDTAYVGLRENLVKSLDGRLSSDIQNKTVEAISELMKKAAPFHPKAYHAIATEALRLAKNADTLVERIKNETGMSVTIVSQEEEGILGFISAVSEADIDPTKVVSWDFGGGSFQITTKCGDNYSVYLGRLGKTPMKNALLKIQEKDVDPTSSPNPISKPQAIQAIQFVKDNIKDVPIELRQKLKQPDVVVLGVGINPLWGMQKNTHYDINRVLKELNCRLNLDDAAIRIKDSIPADRKEAFPHVVSNLILAYGVMEALDITQVHYVGTQGANAIGALLSPQYWVSNKICQKH